MEKVFGTANFDKNVLKLGRLAKEFEKLAEKHGEEIRTALKTSGTSDEPNKDTTPADTICTGGCEGPYHGTFSGIERNKSGDSIGTVPPKEN